jgi:hypothetical protein
MRVFVSFVDRVFGRCVFCMQKAFVASLTAWLIAIAVYGLVKYKDVGAILLMMAATLTIIWVCHIIAFAAREWKGNSSGQPSSLRSVESVNRRQFGFEIIRVLISATALSAAALVPGLAAAANCDCSKCSSSQVCCKTANGGCGCFPKGIQC